jgi:PilZ domain
MQLVAELDSESIKRVGDENQSAVAISLTIADARHKPRFKMETDIRVYSRSCGLLEGRTVDISESGIAAMLALEAPVGEMVELEFTLPSERVAIHAIVRQKNAFRYGFEFVDSDSLHGVIRRTCRDLALTKLCSAGCETQLSEASLPCL